MATVNFSVPEEVKEAFERTFSGQNKSAILTELMRRAIEERRRQQRRSVAIEQMLALRARTRAASDATIRAARRRGRP